MFQLDFVHAAYQWVTSNTRIADALQLATTLLASTTQVATARSTWRPFLWTLAEAMRTNREGGTYEHSRL